MNEETNDEGQGRRFTNIIRNCKYNYKPKPIFTALRKFTSVEPMIPNLKTDTLDCIEENSVPDTDSDDCTISQKSRLLSDREVNNYFI